MHAALVGTCRDARLLVAVRHFDPPVLLAPLGGAVGLDGILRAVAGDVDAAAREIFGRLALEVLLHGERAVQREFLVPLRAAHVVGVAVDVDRELADERAVQDFVDLALAFFGEGRAARLELDGQVTPRDHALHLVLGHRVLRHVGRRLLACFHDPLLGALDERRVEDLADRVELRELVVVELDLPVAERGVDRRVRVRLPGDEPEKALHVREVGHARAAELDVEALLVLGLHALEVLLPVRAVVRAPDAGAQLRGLVERHVGALDRVRAFEAGREDLFHLGPVRLHPRVDADDDRRHLRPVIPGGHDVDDAALTFGHVHVDRRPRRDGVDADLLGLGRDLAALLDLAFLAVAGVVLGAGVHEVFRGHEVDGVRVVRRQVGVDRDVVVVGEVQHDVLVPVQDHDGDDRAARVLGVLANLGAVHVLVFAVAEAERVVDLGDHAQLLEVVVQALEEERCAVAHDHAQRSAVRGVGVAVLVGLREREQLLLHLVRVVLVFDVDLDAVLGHDRAGSRVDAAVGADEAHLAVPGHHVDRDRLLAGHGLRDGGGGQRRMRGRRAVGQIRDGDLVGHRGRHGRLRRLDRAAGDEVVDAEHRRDEQWQHDENNDLSTTIHDVSSPCVAVWPCRPLDC